MATVREQFDLGSLQQQALHWAKLRHERAGSAHLLAALAARNDASASLLRDRRIDPEQLLKTAQRVADHGEEPLRWALTAAEQIARRLRATQVSTAHVVVALLSERRTAAFQALKQLGVDVTKLRLAAMNQAAGQLSRQAESPAVSARQVPSRVQRVTETRASSARRTTRAQLVSPEEFRDMRDRYRRRAEALQRGGGEVSAADASVPASDNPEASPLGSTAQVSGSAAIAEARVVAPASAGAATSARPSEGVGRRFELSKKKFPLLRQIGHNLSAAAARGQLQPAVCREGEVDQILDILAKRFGNNPCVVGPAGVGKTKVVHAVAQRIAQSQHTVDQYILLEVGASALVAGTGMRGGLAARLEQLCKEVAAAPLPVVLFFDEIHQLFAGDGGEELTAEFKLAVSHEKLVCIGATTSEEYGRYIEKDPALHRRFALVEVEEPSQEDAYLMVESLAENFENHHQVQIEREALALSIAWSVKYLSGRALPDKAVSIIDLSGARARRRGLSQVSSDLVAEVIADLTEVPVERLLQTDGERMLQLEHSLAERVVGHEACLRSIASSIRRNAVGLSARRPIGTFLLLGPTGVGKTETAKALAETLFFSEHAMTRIDMSEYSEAHSVARLIGAPPGYVGHESGGQLTEAIRRRPYQVLLLDELEKAHDDVLASFLGVFDEGRMTDGRGRTIDFTNTVIVMTSNLGAREVEATKTVGFQQTTKGNEVAGFAEKILPKVRQALAPELFNRIDEVLVYEPLGRAEIAKIAEKMLDSLAVRLCEGRELSVRFAQSAIDCLIDEGGADLSLGARPMQRTVARLVEAPLAELLLRGEAPKGAHVLVRARRGCIVLDVETELLNPLPAMH